MPVSFLQHSAIDDSFAFVYLTDLFPVIWSLNKQLLVYVNLHNQTELQY